MNTSGVSARSAASQSAIEITTSKYVTFDTEYDFELASAGRSEQSDGTVAGERISLGPIQVLRTRGTDIVDAVAAARAGLGRLCLGFCNAHTVVTALDHPGYVQILRRLTLVNDGVGIDIASRWLTGRRFPENLNGTDLVPRLLTEASPGLRIALVGSRAESVAAAARRIAERHPEHNVVFVSDGFFTPEETPALIDRLNAAAPDMVLVGMGQPRQEVFAVEHAALIAAPVLIVVGALFDFLGGTVPRAPLVVRRMRAEWLFRLWIEPRRLGRRYTVEIVRFLLLVLRLRLSGAAPVGNAGQARTAVMSE